jgi:cardiolipin synthase
MTGMRAQAASSVPGWLPNAITALRIVLVPVWLLLAEGGREGTPAAAACRSWSAGVLLLIGASGLVDGWLARRFGLASRSGAVLDAVADKLAQVVLLAFFALRVPPRQTGIPGWFALLVFGRDLFLLAGYLVVRRRTGTVRVTHRPHGKAASVLLFALLLWINLGGGPQPVAWLLPPLGLVLALSALAYARDGWRQVRATPGAATARPAPG